MIFIIAFIQRVLSGGQSYYGYSKDHIGLLSASILLMLYPFITYQNSMIFYLFIGANAMVIFMKAVSFDRETFKWLNSKKDIHLWENFVTGGYVIYLMIAYWSVTNAILISCSVYPALILHKGLINLGSGLKFFDEATDDPTGKTYGIPLLNIKVRRSNTKTRLVLAAVSILTAIITLCCS